MLSFPVKGTIFLTLEGSLRARVASRSPAVMMEPGDMRRVRAPDSVALRGMIIFMASTST